MKIGVIGAGPAGLVSLKYALDEGHECTVFEQTGVLGGTWVYTDKIRKDENGIPIHSSMYKGMRTNLPKEVMYFIDFPYPKEEIKSYLSQTQVLDYFNNYAKVFDLQKWIKYYKCVTCVEPLNNSNWSLIVSDVKSGSQEFYQFDSVFVCNGHYSSPTIPNIRGQSVYRGKQLHSHDYRKPEPYLNQRVLVVGGGSSGTDIAAKIAELADHVFLSCRHKEKIVSRKNLSTKPEITELSDYGATFQDGTKEDVDVILYCTGYAYTYPFLSEACGISVNDNWVYPLYKHIVNINHPTMFFIGIPFLVPVIPVCDIQVRFSLAQLRKKFLPPLKRMLEELEAYVNERELKNMPLRYYHKIGSEHLAEYFLELSEAAGIPSVPFVISKLYARARMDRNLEDCFQIVDGEHFIQL
ncbi:dimethylaniline monooxygenase [N-oxide-forming] 2-like [Photinus pyralis]|uniref:Flavin-containing monooxygenase n=1 Tax=Photinus pyralis TaxID=7054 RepID=A0A1Y1MJJ1_PHOPY|nr:dimethylaniline monooxygenase [N-oxide-forming] 2-like [Photinus pyralis]XP_031348359.1 dimethylaniline monooxygenase [N-oxide-forming] 2-like [Photinus pyralis]XP_031348364.1 dimethylaniline monooxygenase [N-oxide-forming] 2-like [Photinus pyralis]XP_031353103.1 dimethylaniline monooxygenase [N-oxide-forming] 2-like [Photinus pyralis]XP_031353104.1 dimethylaniline monooxygenase [N-oxide-forming] 2-like [Photinus pyralis]XP_031353105.1 dimethylaniline monooxygenase [N-oxide-forming] 2-like 